MSKPLKARLYDAGSTGADLSPGDPLAMEAFNEIERLEGLVYVPGLWRCPKCSFQLVQACVSAITGAIGARDDPGEKCPNCQTPLWRVSERDAGDRLAKRCEELTLEVKHLKSGRRRTNFKSKR